MAAVQSQDFTANADWQQEAIDLKRQGLESKDIAEAVGKSAATVRKAIAKARERGDLPQLDETGFELPAEPPEQTTVSDFTDGDDRIVWTGENRREVARFLGRGENGTIHARKIDLPTADSAAFVQAQPGDTIVRVGENAYEVVVNVDEPERDLSNLHELDEDVDPLTRFRAEAGPAVGEMQPRPGEEPAGVLEPEPPVMPGTRQLALDLGPNAAPVHAATVTFKSEKWPSGFFGMGDIVTGTFTARIVAVPAKESFDKASGEYRAKDLNYGAEITEISYEAVDPDA